MSFDKLVSSYLNNSCHIHRQKEALYIADIRMIEKIVLAIFIVLSLFFSYYYFTLGMMSIGSVVCCVGAECSLIMIALLELFIRTIRKDALLCPKCCLDKLQALMKKREGSQYCDEFFKDTCNIVRCRNGLWRHILWEKDIAKKRSLFEQLIAFIDLRLEEGKKMQVKDKRTAESFRQELEDIRTETQGLMLGSCGKQAWLKFSVSH